MWKSTLDLNHTQKESQDTASPHPNPELRENKRNEQTRKLPAHTSAQPSLLRCYQLKVHEERSNFSQRLIFAIQSIKLLLKM